MAWSYTRSLTIDHTQCGSADSSNFPVLVSVTNATLKTVANGGHVQNSNGYDIGFYSDSGLTTALFWEIDKYDGVNGQVIMWVKVPTVSHTVDTVIYMAYGDASITTFQSTASSVWDSNYKAVLHLSAPATSLPDSTTNAQNFSTASCASNGTGKIDGGAKYDGTQLQKTSLANAAANQLTSAWTIEAWVNIASSGSYQSILSKRDNSENACFALDISNASPPKVRAYLTNGSNNFKLAQSSASVTTGTFYHLVGSFDGTTVRVYINGGADGTAAYTGSGDNPSTAVILGNDGSAGGQPILNNGVLDEVRLSNTARSASWILTCYNCQNSPGTFITVGSEVSGSVQTVTPSVVGPNRSITGPAIMGGLGSNLDPWPMIFNPILAQ